MPTAKYLTFGTLDSNALTQIIVDLMLKLLLILSSPRITLIELILHFFQQIKANHVYQEANRCADNFPRKATPYQLILLY